VRVAVCLAQVGLEAAINRHVTAHAARRTCHTVNIADTGKAMLLGLAIAAATRAMQDTQAVGGWLRALGCALVPILVGGGLAFPIQSAVLSAVLGLSLVLLLL